MKRRQTDEGIFLRVFDDAIGAIEGSGIPYGVIGGIASAALGRPRWSQDGEDIDVLVRPEDARRVLEDLRTAGFAEEAADHEWLYKGVKEEVTVDVIFKSSGDIYLDAEMQDRLRTEDFKGRRITVVSPEDLVVMKAVAHDEETPQYWHDALSLVARSEMDWDYLVKRARRHGARRVLSLLLYAQSIDLVVPHEVIKTLFSMVSPP